MVNADVLIKIKSMPEKINKIRLVKNAANRLMPIHLPKEFFKWIGCKTPVMAVILLSPWNERIFICNAPHVVRLPALSIGQQFIRLFNLHEFFVGLWIVIFVGMPAIIKKTKTKNI